MVEAAVVVVAAVIKVVMVVINVISILVEIQLKKVCSPTDGIVYVFFYTSSVLVMFKNATISLLLSLDVTN